MSISKQNQKVLSFLEKTAGSPLTIGSFISSIRKGEELTQVEMAKKLGVSKQFLCDLEHGRKTVSPRKASDYANTLGYSTDQFVRLSLQGMLNKEKLPFKVVLEPTNNELQQVFAV